MPNHCTNRLSVSGDPTTLEAFRANVDGGHYDSGEDRPMTFQKVIPMPDSVRDTNSLDELVSAADRGTAFEDIDDKTVGRYVGGPTQWGQRFPDRDAVRERYAVLLENKRLYGFAGWYDWSRNTWGTKWDAYGQFPVEASGDGTELRYRFDTAWVPPVPVLLALAEAYPTLELVLEWHEEGGCGGTVTFKDGSYQES